MVRSPKASVRAAPETAAPPVPAWLPGWNSRVKKWAETPVRADAAAQGAAWLSGSEGLQHINTAHRQYHPGRQHRQHPGLLQKGSVPERRGGSQDQNAYGGQSQDLLKVQKQQRPRHAALPAAPLPRLPPVRLPLCGPRQRGHSRRRSRLAVRAAVRKSGCHQFSHRPDWSRWMLIEPYSMKDSSFCVKLIIVLPVYSLSGKKSVANRIGGRNFCYPCIFAENPLNY